MRKFIFLCCCFLFGTLEIVFPGEIEFSFTSSYDGSKQLACAYIPEAYQQTPRPLLVVAHYMNGNRFTARALNYYEECEKRKWLLVCPELHGNNTDGKTSFGALSAQHDILDAIAWIKTNYQVDTSRIYLAGRSMGGQLAALMAAKYPHLFAAVVSGQPVTDLVRFVKENKKLAPFVESECGKLNEQNWFEYQRRSAINYARNFRYIPLILWHGTEDTVVSPEHSLRLYEEIKKYYVFQESVFWLQAAGHNALNFPASWVCERLQYYQNVSDIKTEAGTRFYQNLDFLTDEAGDFFWVQVIPASSQNFATAKVRIDNDQLWVEADNLDTISINLKALPPATRLKKAYITSATDLNLRIVSGEKIMEISTVRKGKKREAEFLLEKQENK